MELVLLPKKMRKYFALSHFSSNKVCCRTPQLTYIWVGGTNLRADIVLFFWFKLFNAFASNSMILCKIYFYLYLKKICANQAMIQNMISQSAKKHLQVKFSKTFEKFVF